MIRSEWSFCYKKDFFHLLGEKVIPKKPIKFHLKYIQDCYALAEIKKICAKKTINSFSIGEIGANHSRVLPGLRSIQPSYMQLMSTTAQ
jgi:hypothetical protein